jgi:ABC-type lipoprotein release transport system permease subunit
LTLLRMLLGTGLRNRWRSWLALSLLTALVVGLVLAGAATARRTVTAFPRYEAAHGFDSFFYSVDPVPGAASLPSVASSIDVRTPVAGSPECACSHPINDDDFTVEEVPPGQLSEISKLVAGSLPNQSDPSQVLASQNFEQDGLHIGSVLHVPLVSAAQRSAITSDQNITPAGPLVALRVVGFEISETEFPTTSNAPSYDLYVTSGFDQRFNAKTLTLHEYFFRLRHGAASLPQFDAQARAHGGLSASDLDATASFIATSIDPQAVGWWLLTGLAALIGMLALGQALARQAAIEAESHPVLRALGASRRQLFALAMTLTFVIALVGAAGGVALAALSSLFTPVGEARLADPTPGFSFDALLLVPAGLAAVAIVLALGLWPAVKWARPLRHDDRPVIRPSRAVTALSAAGASASALIGVRHALERGRGRAAMPVSSALVGAILAVAALCATAVFGASLTHLTHTPSQYGQQFDAWFAVDGTGTTSQNEQLLDALERPGVTAITAGLGSPVFINGKAIDGIAGQNLRGRTLLTTIAGRPPTADDEVALGAKTMAQLGVHIGSLVRVTIPSPGPGNAVTGRFRIVGTAVLPSDFNIQGLGTGAVFTLDSLLAGHCASGSNQRACQMQSLVADAGVFLVHTEPGASGQAALAQLSRAYPSQVNFPSPPTDLVNFGEAVNFPLIFGLIAVLFGAATLLHLLLSTLSQRRREMGLLKSLGMVRRQIALTVSWQTTTVAIIGIVVGVPLGVAVGRLVWHAFATNLGVFAGPVTTAWVIVAVAVAALVAANLLAVVPAVIAARSPAATLLKAE